MYVIISGLLAQVNSENKACKLQLPVEQQRQVCVPDLGEANAAIMTRFKAFLLSCAGPSSTIYMATPS